jgi:hypothetical protein
MSADTEELIAELRAGLDGVKSGDRWAYVERDKTEHAPNDALVFAKTCIGGTAIAIRPKLMTNEEWRATGNHIARCSPENIRALLDRIASLEAALAEAQSERDEATNWTDIVDRHGTDQFDDLAEAWLALPAIQRTTNAAISTFAKWANDDLMQRFRQNQLSMFHLAYVEGCLAGVKAAEAAALSSSKQKDGE